MDFTLIAETFPVLMAALPKTLMLASSALVIGFFLAVLVALARLSTVKPISWSAYGFVYFFRSTPLLVQLFLIYYGSGQFRHELEAVGLWTFFREPWFCAILSLTLNTAAYSSEIIRGGLQSVAKGMIEAAQAIGLSRWHSFRDVIFPIAIRQALPGYGNEVILMVKATSLASTITILEITGQAERIIGQTFKPFEVFFVAGAIYLALNFALSQLIAWLERRLDVTGASRNAKAPTVVLRA